MVPAEDVEIGNLDQLAGNIHPLPPIYVQLPRRCSTSFKAGVPGKGFASNVRQQSIMHPSWACRSQLTLSLIEVL